MSSICLDVSRQHVTHYAFEVNEGEQPPIIQRLYIDSQQRLWLATRSGIYYFDEGLEKFIPFSLPITEVPGAGSSRYRVY